MKETTGYITVTPEEFSKEIRLPEDYLLDVRTKEEFDGGHIGGAHNLDVTAPDFEERAKRELPKNKRIAVYCGSGKRSAKASQDLSAEGFKVVNLDGGLAAWIAAGLPVVN